MEYLFEVREPITEEQALARVEELGMHPIAFDQEIREDETLHWHEFDTVAFIISGTGSFEDEHCNVTLTQPGCLQHAPAGWLHRVLAGPTQRVVLGTSIPYEQMSHPINKDPAERPVALAS